MTLYSSQRKECAVLNFEPTNRAVFSSFGRSVGRPRQSSMLLSLCLLRQRSLILASILGQATSLQQWQLDWHGTVDGRYDWREVVAGSSTLPIRSILILNHPRKKHRGTQSISLSNTLTFHCSVITPLTLLLTRLRLFQSIYSAIIVTCLYTVWIPTSPTDHPAWFGSKGRSIGHLFNASNAISEY